MSTPADLSVASRKRKASARKAAPPAQVSLPPRLLGVKAAAAYLGSTVWYARTLAWSGAVPYLKLGKRMLFDKVDLDAYVEKQKQSAVA